MAACRAFHSVPMMTALMFLARQDAPTLAKGGA
jgi:hypothetical protein